MKQHIWRFAGLVLVLGLVCCIRLRLAAMPLERDEGEYAYAGQLLLQGVPPYQDLYSMKWPGTFAAYALIMGLFGQSITAIHFGLLLVALATALLVFLLAKPICGPTGGVVAAGTCALLSITPASFGLAAHATHFVILPALGGLLLIRTLEERVQWLRLLLAGVLLGLAALMKQAGVAFGIFALAWVFWVELSNSTRNWRRWAFRSGWLAGGFLLPLVVTAVLLAAAGVFNHFWLWTFKYARAYVGLNSFDESFHRFLANSGRLIRQAPGLWSLAGAGLILICCERELRRHWLWVLSFLLFSFVAVCPGGYFRGHYFLVLFPAFGLLAGVAVEGGSRLLRAAGAAESVTVLPIVVFAAAAGWCIFSSRGIFFQEGPTRACRSIYGANPFPESVQIGRYLESHCPPEARIAVIGSEPQIYFYSHRRSATGYVYTYPLLERQPYARAMQAEMIQELTRAEPAYFIFVSQPSSWLPKDNSDFAIIEWFIQYKQTRLESVGYVDIFPDGRTEYSWSGTGNPRSDQWVQIYRRRERP